MISRLDVLVNNVYAGIDYIVKGLEGPKFYETDPVREWDVSCGVGLRGHYICSAYGGK